MGKNIAVEEYFRKEKGKNIIKTACVFLDMVMEQKEEEITGSEKKTFSLTKDEITYDFRIKNQNELWLKIWKSGEMKLEIGYNLENKSFDLNGSMIAVRGSVWMLPANPLDNNYQHLVSSIIERIKKIAAYLHSENYIEFDADEVERRMKQIEKEESYKKLSKQYNLQLNLVKKRLNERE